MKYVNQSPPQKLFFASNSHFIPDIKLLGDFFVFFV
jgi:hypothetical protein